MGTDRKRSVRATPAPADTAPAVTRPEIVEQTTLGNAALQNLLGTTPGSGGVAGMTGMLGGRGSGGSSKDDAKKGAENVKERFAKGKWADTLQGGRYNARNSDPTLGGLAGDASRFATGGGKGHASTGDDTTPSMETPIKSSQGDSAGTSTDSASSGKESAASLIPASNSYVVGPATNLTVPKTKTQRPREDDAGGAVVGPTPLDKGKDPARGMVTTRGLAGGRGDGRGEIDASGGAGLFDGKLIMAKNGGAVGKEAKEPDSSAIAMEIALAQARFTDPKKD